MGLTTEDSLRAPLPPTSAQAANSSDESQTHDTETLTDSPRVVIEPGRTWTGLRDLWAYRELLYFLIWRDLKVRYKQTFLGVAWAVIQPLLTMLIFTLIFSKVAKIDSDQIPYPVFAYAALLPWTFFATAIAS